MRAFQKCLLAFWCFGVINGTPSAFGQKIYEDIRKIPFEGNTYLSVFSKGGDQVMELLEQFNLQNYACNIAHFFAINGLDENYRLRKGVRYLLPIQVKTYNGTSIRTTLKIDDWKKAKAIADYNHALREQGIRDDNFIHSRRLWIPWHLVHCTEEEVVVDKKPGARPVNLGGLPAEPGSAERRYPIFGKTLEKTPLLSNRLNGRVFYLVSGHGGPDTGAQGSHDGHDLCEDEYAYDVTLRLMRLLLQHGATAYMIVRDPNDGIRDNPYLKLDKDEVVWGNKKIPFDQKERLQQRCDIINQLTAEHKKWGVKQQTMIEIHVDSRHQDKRIDVFFYHRKSSGASKTLATKLLTKFKQEYESQLDRTYHGTISTRNLYSLDNTQTPRAVYIELGNIQNELDQQRLLIRTNRQALANWIFQTFMSE